MEGVIHIEGIAASSGRAEISLPASKSVLSRITMMAGLQEICVQDEMYQGQADDACLMRDVLQRIDRNNASGSPLIIDCRNAATVFRMAAVYAAYRGGEYLFTGTMDLRRRPVNELAMALKDAGVQVEFTEKTGFPPLHLHSHGLKSERLTLCAKESSQHISGFLMAGAVLPDGITLEIHGSVVSKPYIDLTVKLMQEAGARVVTEGQRIRVENTGYPAFLPLQEADWSSAAFFYAALTLLPIGTSVLLKGLRMDSGQGDREAVRLFGMLGIHTETFESDILITHLETTEAECNADFTHCPDLFNAFAIAAALRQAECTLTGLNNLRYKESDRLQNFLHGLQAMGYKYQLEEGALHLIPGTSAYPEPLRLDSSGDHRMVMSFAVAGLKHPLVLTNPYVVSKSFPGFFEEFSRIAIVKAL